MGKTLIIKGADFSANAVDVASIGVWLYQIPPLELEGASHQLNKANNFAFGEQEYLDMHVTKVRFRCGAVGTLEFKHCATTNTIGQVLTTLESISLTANDVGKLVEKNVDFTFPSSGWMCLKCDVSGVLSTYNDTTGLSEIVTVWSPTYANSRLTGYSMNIDLFGTFPD